MSGTLSPGFADAVGEAQSCFRLVLDAMAHPGRVHAVRPVPAPLCDAAAAVVLTLVDQETPLWLDPDAMAAQGWIAFHTGAPVVEEPGRAMFAVALSFPEVSFPESFFAIPFSTATPVSAHAAAAPASPAMPGAGPASTPFFVSTARGVDGGPSAAMTMGAAALTNGAARLTPGGAPLAVDAAPPGTPLAVGANPSAMNRTKPPQPVTPPGSSTFPIGTDEAPETSATLILQIASLTTGRRYRLEGPGLRQPVILTADGLPSDFAAIWQRNHALFPCGIDLILCAGNQLAALPRSVSMQEA